MVQEGSYGLGYSNGGENTWAEQGVAAESVVEDILGSGDISVHHDKSDSCSRVKAETGPLSHFLTHLRGKWSL